MAVINGVKGTRDFYPKDYNTINYLFSKSKDVSKKYGFEEYEAPIMEYASLWQIKSSGDLPNQMYTFKDKGDELIALRPEMTPSLARMIAAKHKELKKPIKWFSFPRCFRYEQPQKGRLREFFQYNADIICEKSPLVHAEMIALAIDMLKAFGLTSKDFYIRLNNRQIVDSIIDMFGVNKADLMHLLDKKDKLTKKEFNSELQKLGINETEKLLTILDSSFDKLPTLNSNGEEAKEFTNNIIKILAGSGYGDYIKFDLSVVRGLTYYTDTVFEAFDKKGEFRAILGGGSYSNLISDFDSSAKLDGIGFGMGDAVLSLLLQSKGLIPEYSKNVEYYIATIGECNETAFKIANIIRQKHSVELNYSSKGITKQLEYASLIGAEFVVIVGERDLKEGFVTIKDMSTGNETKEPISKILKGL